MECPCYSPDRCDEQMCIFDLAAKKDMHLQDAVPELGEAGLLFELHQVLQQGLSHQADSQPQRPIGASKRRALRADRTCQLGDHRDDVIAERGRPVSAAQCQPVACQQAPANNTSHL